MKYYVVKGYSGLADRLKVLSYVVRRVQRSRTLIIDWSDSIHWNDNFEHYFELVGMGMPVAGKSELTKIMGESSVYPAIFRGHLGAVSFPFNKSEPRGPMVSKKKIPRYTNFNNPSRVIVSCALGIPGNLNHLIANHLRFTPNILERVAEVYKQLKGPYVSMHIRYTDKKTKLAPFHSYLAHHRPKHVYLASDNPGIFRIFRRRYPGVNFQNATTIPNITKAFGSFHTLKDKFLSQYGTNKRESNVQTLIDLCILSVGSHFIGSHNSGFSRLVNVIRANLPQILPGYTITPIHPTIQNPTQSKPKPKKAKSIAKSTAKSRAKSRGQPKGKSRAKSRAAIRDKSVAKYRTKSTAKSMSEPARTKKEKAAKRKLIKQIRRVLAKIKQK